MKKVSWLILVIICTLLISTSLADNFYYHGFTWGDSESSVEQKERAHLLYDYTRENFYTLTYSDYPLGDDLYSAWVDYCFENGRLVAIAQTFTSISDTLYKKLTKEFNDLYKKQSKAKWSDFFDLLVRYGYDRSALNEKDKKYKSIDLWKFDETYIYLNYIDNHSINVWYIPTDKEYKNIVK